MVSTLLLMRKLHVGVRIHAGTMARSLLGTSTSVSMVRVFRLRLRVKRTILPVNGALQCIDANLHRIAIVNVADGIFRHGQAQTEQIAFGELDERQALGLRVGSGLHERARIGIAPDDDAVSGADTVV